MKRAGDLPVMILTNELDVTADRVVHALAERSVPVERLNIEAATSHSTQSWNSSDSARVAYRSVWWRQFVPHFGPEWRCRDLFEADTVLIQRRQWAAWLSTIPAPPANWMNSLWAARRCENKVEQIRIAGQCGLLVPATCVTNDAAIAAEFERTHGHCVVKALSSGYWELSDQSFVFTTRLDEAILEGSGWFEQPITVQVEIEDGLEVRVVQVGEQTFAIATPRTATDWRTAHKPTWTPIDVPAEVRLGARRFMAEFGLSYAAFDFIVDKSGMWWFLEANQAGEWGFVERAIGGGIADAVARFLAFGEIA